MKKSKIKIPSFAHYSIDNSKYRFYETKTGIEPDQNIDLAEDTEDYFEEMMFPFSDDSINFNTGKPVEISIITYTKMYGIEVPYTSGEEYFVFAKCECGWLGNGDGSNYKQFIHLHNGVDVISEVLGNSSYFCSSGGLGEKYTSRSIPSSSAIFSRIADEEEGNQRRRAEWDARHIEPKIGEPVMIHLPIFETFPIVDVRDYESDQYEWVVDIQINGVFVAVVVERPDGDMLFTRNQKQLIEKLYNSISN